MPSATGTAPPPPALAAARSRTAVTGGPGWLTATRSVELCVDSHVRDPRGTMPRSPTSDVDPPRPVLGAVVRRLGLLRGSGDPVLAGVRGDPRRPVHRHDLHVGGRSRARRPLPWRGGRRVEHGERHRQHDRCHRLLLRPGQRCDDGGGAHHRGHQRRRAGRCRSGARRAPRCGRAGRRRAGSRRGGVGQRRRQGGRAIDAARVAVCAVVAGIGFGLLFVFLDQTSDDSGVWPLFIAQLTSLPIVVVDRVGAPPGTPAASPRRRR